MAIFPREEKGYVHMAHYDAFPESLLRDKSFLSVISAIAEYLFAGGDTREVKTHLRRTYNFENKNLHLTQGVDFGNITYGKNIVTIPFARITIFRDEKNTPLPQLNFEDNPFLIEVWKKNKTPNTKEPSGAQRIEYENFVIQTRYNDVRNESFFNLLDDVIKKLEEDKKTGTGKKRPRQKGKVVDLRGLVQYKDKAIIIIADLHGNGENLDGILQNDGLEGKLESEEAIIVIAGDMICPAEQAIRGRDGLPYPKTKAPLTEIEKSDKLCVMEGSLRVMERILGLKSMYPTSVYYLLGNHDNPYFFKTSKPISQNTCFQNHLLLRYGRECRNQYIKFLNMSPLLFIADGIVVTHGGPIKGSVLDNLRKKGSDLVEVLKEEKLDLKDMDYDKDQPVSNAISQLALCMHRLYNNRKWLTYSPGDVEAFLNAIRMPDNVKETYLVVGHDHDFNRPEQDDTETGKVYEEQGFWAWTFGPSLPNHYLIFSGGVESLGYAIFKDGGIAFRAVR
jgi:hypothetical protein